MPRPISEALSEIADEKGLSAPEIARRGGTTAPTAHRVLTDPDKVPRADTLAAVARGLGLTPGQLGRLILDTYRPPE